MPESPAISVIVPVHREHGRLAAALGSARSASIPVETIIVLNDGSLRGRLTAEGPNERAVFCERRGRGFALARGVSEARGDIVLLLHSDTVLPPRWDAAVVRALSDGSVVGGGFHMAFDISSRYLDFLIMLSDAQVRLRRAMWGDRAVFARAGILRRCVDALDVPLFEDVRLSKALRRQGRLVFLEETVQTSADQFWRNGPYRQTVRILKARLWYAFGGDPQQIYDYYYSR